MLSPPPLAEGYWFREGAFEVVFCLLLDLLAMVAASGAQGSSGSVLEASAGAALGSPLESETPLPPKVSWAEILAATKNQVNTKLDFYEPMVINGKTLVAPPEEIRSEGSLHWRYTLVGHFVGKRPAFLVVSTIAKRLWVKDGLREVIAQEQGCIFFMFSDEGGMKNILEKGPWFIAGRFLVLKRWERNLNLTAEASISKLPVWALLYNVPVELWMPKGLSYISSALGKPLLADSATLSRRRLNYARVCVEVDAGDTLIEEIDLASGDSEDPSTDPIKINVVYQWKPPRCSHCLVFGHTSTNCELHPVVVGSSSTETRGKTQAQVGPSAKQFKGGNRGQWQRRGRVDPNSSSVRKEDSIPKEPTQRNIQLANPFQELSNLPEEGSIGEGQKVQGLGHNSKEVGESDPESVTSDVSLSSQQTSSPMQNKGGGEQVEAPGEQPKEDEQHQALPCTPEGVQRYSKQLPAVGLLIAADLSSNIQTSTRDNLLVSGMEPNKRSLSCDNPEGNSEQVEEGPDWTQITRKGKSKGRGANSPMGMSSEQIHRGKATVLQEGQVGGTLQQQKQSPSPELVTGLAKRVRFIDGLHPAGEGRVQKEKANLFQGLNAGPSTSSPC